MADLPFSVSLGEPLPEPTESEDGVYELNDDHAIEAINHLIDAFKYGPRNQGVLATVGAQLQEIEDAYWALYNAFDGDTATGDQLDILGRLVGERRQGRLDAEYRGAVKVRIKVNCSNGSIPTMLSIALAMVPSATVRIAETSMMTLTIDFSTTGTSTLRTLYQMLRRAKAGGVRLIVSYGGGIVGSEDGSPLGEQIGAEDGSPLGFLIGSEM